MSEFVGFEPNWASHPGRTLSHLLDSRGWSWEDSSLKIGLFIPELIEICCGQAPVTDDVAAKLEKAGLGSSVFWLKRQANYDEALERGVNHAQ